MAISLIVQQPMETILEERRSANLWCFLQCLGASSQGILEVRYLSRYDKVAAKQCLGIVALVIEGTPSSV